MASATITFQNPRTGHIRQAPVGFSWTVLLFGPFPPLFRGDWKWAVVIGLIAFFTMALSNLVFMLAYNKLYIRDLISSGFRATGIANGTLKDAAATLQLDLPTGE